MVHLSAQLLSGRYSWCHGFTSFFAGSDLLEGNYARRLSHPGLDATLAQRRAVTAVKEVMA